MAAVEPPWAEASCHSGPVKRAGDQVLEFGQLAFNVYRLVVRIPSHHDLVIDTVADPARVHPPIRIQRLALFGLPAVEHAEVDAFDEQGRSLGSASSDPTSAQRPLRLTPSTAEGPNR